MKAFDAFVQMQCTDTETLLQVPAVLKFIFLLF